MRVYLSSTLIDLLPERQAVRDALGGECTVVESYTADERSVRESCTADVAGCDIYIGIIGMRYGVPPPGQTCSITELEYQEARARKMPTWIFVKDEGHVIAPFHDAVSKENPRERIETFRSALTSATEEAVRGVLFNTPEDLNARVLKALVRHVQRQGETNGERKRPPIAGDPYPGLRAFRTHEADRFFGRDDEVEAPMDRLLARGQRFVALIGASGSGKSSLVYAGLIPKLKRLPASTPWVAVSMIPRELGNDPFLPLANALCSQFPDSGWRPAELAQRLRNRPADIAAVAEQAMAKAGVGAQILLFVDQFEELFAHKVDAGSRSAFFALLAAAVACPWLRVVISMRADFYALWPQDEVSVKLLHDGHFPVAVPGQRALAKMIEEPARAAGLHFKPPQLVQRLLDDTGTAPGALALAEFALAQLYEHRSGPDLTAAAYEQIGGVAGAIDGLAEQAVALARQALAQDGGVLDDEAFSRLFVALGSVEEKAEGLAVVRRRATAGELPAAVLALAQHLVDKRLLVISGGSVRGDGAGAGGAGGHGPPALFEVGHEAVFSHWQRFNDWHKRYGEALAACQQVERAAAEWHKAGSPDILRWGWERQKPALEALRKLSPLPLPALDAEYTDAGIAVWRALQATLPDSPLKAFLYPEPLALIDKLAVENTSHQRREEIGLRLNQLSDPRRGVGLGADGLPDIAWIDVPAGEVTIEIGTEPGPASDEKPRRDRKLKAASDNRFAVQNFQLARYPVTWCQYRAFLVAEDGYANPQWWEGRPRKDFPGPEIWSFPNYPAVNVSWFDAVAFCLWLSANQGGTIRLPTECEWQRAAVADTGQDYPWHGDWDPARANSVEAGIGRTVAVGLYPPRRSPFGFDDLSGNVSEWCLNDRASPDRMSNDVEASRVLRGGSWGDGAGGLRPSNRDSDVPSVRSYGVGLRLCRVSPHRKAAAHRRTGR